MHNLPPKCGAAMLYHGSYQLPWPCDVNTKQLPTVYSRVVYIYTQYIIITFSLWYVYSKSHGCTVIGYSIGSIPMMWPIKLTITMHILCSLPRPLATSTQKKNSTSIKAEGCMRNLILLKFLHDRSASLDRPTCMWAWLQMPRKGEGGGI